MTLEVSYRSPYGTQDTDSGSGGSGIEVGTADHGGGRDGGGGRVGGGGGGEDGYDDEPDFQVDG